MDDPFDITDLPIEDHPDAISAALDQLETDLEQVKVVPKGGQ